MYRADSDHSPSVAIHHGPMSLPRCPGSLRGSPLDCIKTATRRQAVPQPDNAGMAEENVEVAEIGIACAALLMWRNPRARSPARVIGTPSNLAAE
jgi:hypothetical protein